ncbi:helicase associated domain-containing protein [Streptomyces tricolor]|nr:helicase associated domain-containing protein [Streptomyces tricolor]
MAPAPPTVEEGLTAARGWAEEHGHLLAPGLNATYQGYKVGIWLKNHRAAIRRAQELEQRRAEGLPVESAAGAMSAGAARAAEDRPAWCPAWPVECGSAASTSSGSHLEEAGGTLPTEPGE